MARSFGLVLLVIIYASGIDALPPSNDAYNILAIFPFPSRSHQVVFEPILTELVARGHRLTVYSNYPGTIRNATRDISLRPCMPQHITGLEIVWRLNRSSELTTFGFVKDVFDLTATVELVMRCRPIVELANSDATGEKYDLLITEFFVNDWVLGFAEKFGIPFVGVSSTTAYSWLSYAFALPESPAYIRYGQTKADFRGTTSLWRRLENVYNYVLFESLYRYYKYTRTHPIMAALFDRKDFPPIETIIMNTSLLLTNSHFSVNPVRPLVPAVVEIGGISIGPKEPLPISLEKFINESDNGVVYFSMGSVLQSYTFPVDQKDALLKAFSKLPMRVIWKYERNDLPREVIPDNVLISGWFPQRSILAHPKVKLFISHCGQTSFHEAIFEAVPVLALPIFNDQLDNAFKLVSAGAAEKLDFDHVTEEVILEKINQLLHNEGYKRNMKRLSDIFKDRPMSPLDTTMYWIEYVIRHKGAHHLKSAAVGMPWYRYFLVDVVVVVILLILIFSYVIYSILKLVLKLIMAPFKGVKHKTN